MWLPYNKLGELLDPVTVESTRSPVGTGSGVGNSSSIGFGAGSMRDIGILSLGA
jgi:hypothetical protein